MKEEVLSQSSKLWYVKHDFHVKYSFLCNMYTQNTQIEQTFI